jgi:hypothetical protein
MKVGDSIRLVRILSDVHEDTAPVLQLCLGHTFIVDHFNETGCAGLVVDSVTGSQHETVWIAPTYLEKVRTPEM